MYKVSSKKAFTLPEVLITLGVIAVISALTIPLLVSKYRHKKIESYLVKSYTMLNQALIHSEADNGSAIYWNWRNGSRDTSFDKNFFDNYFAPYLSIINVKFKNVFTQWNKSGYEMYFLSGSRNGNRSGYIYELSNGFSILPSIQSHINGTLGSLLVVIPNANRKHLIEGLDVFEFVIRYRDKNDKNSIVIAPGSYQMWSCGACKNERQTFINRCKGLLDSSGISATSSCTFMIYCNNWEIPDDYPYKF